MDDLRKKLFSDKWEVQVHLEDTTQRRRGGNVTNFYISFLLLLLPRQLRLRK